MLLLRKCALPEAVYMLRSLAPPICLRFLAPVERSHLVCFAAILSTPDDITAGSTLAAQIALPLGSGGAGLTRLSDIAAAAYVASVYDTHELVQRVCPLVAQLFAAAAAAPPTAALQEADPDQILIDDTPPPQPHPDLRLPCQSAFHAALHSLLPASRALLDPLAPSVPPPAPPASGGTTSPPPASPAAPPPTATSTAPPQAPPRAAPARSDESTDGRSRATGLQRRLRRRPSRHSSLVMPFFGIRGLGRSTRPCAPRGGALIRRRRK